jgi:hypothetical protein
MRQLFRTALVLGLTALPPSAMACAACFGKSDDAMAHGMNMGIFTLLIVIVAVLAGIASLGIASFGFFLVRRSARMATANVAADSAGQSSAQLSRSISQTTP